MKQEQKYKQQYNIETEFKFSITKEQFREALKERRINILTMQLIRQMWLHNSVNTKENENENKNKNTVSFKSRIRSITNINEIHNPTKDGEETSNTVEYSHCVKYPLLNDGDSDSDSDSVIECEQLISEEEFIRLRKIGTLKGKIVTEKLRYSIMIKGEGFEELLRLWIVSVDIYDDREEVNVEIELMEGLISDNKEIRTKEEVEKMRGLVERIKKYLSEDLS